MRTPPSPTPSEAPLVSSPRRERYDNRVFQEWPRVDEPPRVWVGSLLDYDAGLLHGRWVGAARPATEIDDDIRGMLGRSPTAEQTGRTAERWAIFDAEGFGDDAEALGARTDVTTLSGIGLRIKSYGGAFAAWARLHERDLVGQRRFRDAYLGHYETAQDYVEFLIDARNFERVIEAAVPAALRPYVGLDVVQLTADLIEYGDVMAVPNPDGGVWLFAERPPV